MSVARDFARSGLPERLVKSTGLLFPTGGVTFYSWDPAEQMLVPSAANQLSRDDGLTARPLGVGASGRAGQRRRPVIANDYSAAFARSTPAARAGVTSAMSVPLLADGELLGTLSVGSNAAALRFGCDELAALIEQQSSLLGVSGWWTAVPATHAARLAELEALCDAHHRSALGVCFALLSDLRLAEEVVQDVLLAIWRSGIVCHPSSPTVRPWLLSMVRQRCELLAGAPADRAQDPHHPDTRAVLDLMCAGLPSGEVAEWMGWPAGAVACSLREALDHCRTENARRAPSVDTQSAP